MQKDGWQQRVQFRLPYSIGDSIDVPFEMHIVCARIPATQSARILTREHSDNMLPQKEGTIFLAQEQYRNQVLDFCIGFPCWAITSHRALLSQQSDRHSNRRTYLGVKIAFRNAYISLLASCTRITGQPSQRLKSPSLALSI